ncbi:MAG: M48 family metallopeptidase [Alistipes senegalensis]|nr:M48 family metallopeptidase [Alistipes senegalensis]
MTSTLDHPRLGAVTLASSPRARRISIRVRPSGDVRVSFPCGVSRQRALAFLDEKVVWVETARRRLAARRAAL